MSVERFAAAGVAVIPLFPRSKRPRVRWERYQQELPPPALLGAWFRPDAPYNAAVVCGWRGLTVLDFDDLRAYTSWLLWCAGEGGIARSVAEQTYRVQTRRGVHVYAFVDDGPGCHKMGRARQRDGGYREPWGEVKGRRGYVLIPPSVHPSGVRYRAVDEYAPILAVPTLAAVLPEPPAEPVPFEPVELPVLARVASSADVWPSSRSVVAEIKARVPILSLLSGAEPSGGNGRWYKVACPFHDDRDPSMWVDAQRGICRCYAGCTPKPLDVILLVARVRGISNREAIRELARAVA